MLDPHGALRDQVELLELDLIGPRVGGDRLASDLRPVLQELVLEQLRFHAVAARDAAQHRGDRIEEGLCSHGGMVGGLTAEVKDGIGGRRRSDLLRATIMR